MILKQYPAEILDTIKGELHWEEALEASIRFCKNPDECSE